MGFAGCRATVMGLGHFGGGAGAARWLAQQGARVTITDRAPEEQVADAVAALADVPIAAFHLGGHHAEDFRDADLVVVNPAVRPGDHFIELATSRGARVVTEIDLFLEASPARVIGVTGSNGKSTTAAMVAAAIRASGKRAWLGGNLGGSLLTRLSEIHSDDWVVLELSSFQLFYLSPNVRAPTIAVVTNCVPNHLNWHPDFAHYVAAKQQLLLRQQPHDHAVLNVLDPVVTQWTDKVRGRWRPPLALSEVPALRVPGDHNRLDAACAAAAAQAAGCLREDVCRGLAEFAGLPQRLELFAMVGGRRFYNDSAATTPESTMAGLNALAGPIWLLAGGIDKGADFAAMIDRIGERASGVAFFGAVGPSLQQRLRQQRPKLPCTAVPTLSEALDWCWVYSQPGANILLSPGCASLDQFTNYRHRGEVFCRLVARLAERPLRPGLPPVIMETG